MSKYFRAGDAVLSVVSGEPIMTAVTELPTMSGAGEEKHRPIITKTERGYLVTVSTIEHPMEPGHYIEWIELSVGRVLHRVLLSPSDKPVFEFLVVGSSGDMAARIYCNIHGMWLS